MVLHSHVLAALRELSDLAYQKRVWLNLQSDIPVSRREQSSIEDAGCHLYFDSELLHQLDHGTGVYSESIDDRLREFKVELEALYMYVNTYEELCSPPMAQVRERAAELLLDISRIMQRYTNRGNL